MMKTAAKACIVCPYSIAKSVARHLMEHGINWEHNKRGRRLDVLDLTGIDFRNAALQHLLRLRASVILLCVVLSGCSDAREKYVGGNVRAVNHTTGAINWMSINGYRVHGGGGYSCCISLPLLWRPGLEVEVEWEVDPQPFAKIKKHPVVFGFDEEAWADHAAKFRIVKKVVQVEPWPATKSCAMQVHFFVCDRVLVTTMCMVDGHPDYPIKEGYDMKEPEVCPE
jgi:hypothetical protein